MTLHIQYLSDLHLESCAFTLKVHPSAGVLVLAGDIATQKTHHLFKQLLEQTNGIPTVYLPGNHEFYGASHTMYERRKELEAACAGFANVHLLDDTWVDIAGVRFVGGTLWSDFQLPFWQGGHYASDFLLAQKLAETGISDFIRIKGLSTNLMTLMHRHTRSVIQLSKQAELPTVVCTHFLPSIRSIRPPFEKSTLNPYFASNCEYLMGGVVKAWIHGHTHASCNYTIEDTQVVCNPRGYDATENPSFDSFALIKI